VRGGRSARALAQPPVVEPPGEASPVVDVVDPPSPDDPGQLPAGLRGAVENVGVTHALTATVAPHGHTVWSVHGPIATQTPIVGQLDPASFTA
jgi:hypothetical protein